MLYVGSRTTDRYDNLAFEEYIFTSFREENIFLLWRNAPCMVMHEKLPVLQHDAGKAFAAGL